MMRALLLAMLDRMDEAWAVALPAEERLRELAFATGGAWLGEIALLAGDYEAAASYLRDACDRVEAIGNEGELSTYAPMLGRVLSMLGRHDEAELLAQRGRELGHQEDIMTQHGWRQTQALVYSARGRHDEAERLAREAVDLSLRGDSLLKQGEALSDMDVRRISSFLQTYNEMRKGEEFVQREVRTRARVRMRWIGAALLLIVALAIFPWPRKSGTDRTART